MRWRNGRISMLSKAATANKAKSGARKIKNIYRNVEDYLKSRSVWFENGTEKARKQRNENSKRLIKSAILGNADI